MLQKGLVLYVNIDILYYRQHAREGQEIFTQRCGSHITCSPHYTCCVSLVGRVTESVLHKPPPHGCGTDTPAHTHPIYPAAVCDYQTSCVSIQFPGSTFACGESFCFSWGTPIKCIHVNRAGTGGCCWWFMRAAMENAVSDLGLCLEAFSPRVAAILRGGCMLMLMPSSLNECYMQLSCEESALQSWWCVQQAGGISDMFVPCSNGVTRVRGAFSPPASVLSPAALNVMTVVGSLM